MTTQIVTLDSQLNCWIYGYHIRFELDVLDLVDVLSPNELKLLLELETKTI